MTIKNKEQIKELEREINRCDESGHNEDYRDECYAKIDSLKSKEKSK